MKLKTFTAPTMEAAMRQVRNALGDDAIILSTRTERSSGQVMLTAALEDEPLAPPTITPPAITPPASATVVSASGALDPRSVWAAEMAALFTKHRASETLSEHARRVAASLPVTQLLTLQSLSATQSKHDLADRLACELMAALFRFTAAEGAANAPLRIMLVGPSGVGKTLAIAKLATQLVLAGQAVHVLTMDAERAGGFEQLNALTSILSLNLLLTPTREDVAQSLAAIPTHAHVLIDTPGLNPLDGAACTEAKRVMQLPGITPWLTLPAGLDAEEACEIAASIANPAISHLLVTRLDSARRYGGVLSAAHMHTLNLVMLGASASATAPLHPATPRALAECLLRGASHGSLTPHTLASQPAYA